MEKLGLSQRKYKLQPDGEFRRSISFPEVFTREEYKNWNKIAKKFGLKDIRALILEFIEPLLFDEIERILKEIEQEIENE